MMQKDKNHLFQMTILKHQKKLKKKLIYKIHNKMINKTNFKKIKIIKKQK